MTLFDDDPQTKALAKRPKKSEAVVGPVRTCMDLFYELHIAKWSAPADVAAWRADPESVPKGRLVTPRIQGGKHGKKFKEMTDAWGEETTTSVIRQFFATTDPRVTNTDYTLDAFFAKADYLRLQLARRPRLDARQQRNIDAIERATGRRE